MSIGKTGKNSFKDSRLSDKTKQTKKQTKKTLKWNFDKRGKGKWVLWREKKNAIMQSNSNLHFAPKRTEIALFIWMLTILSVRSWGGGEWNPVLF